MDKSEELEKCKKEIRSILISYQKGCFLAEFNRSYRELIGKRLPSGEFGFRSDIEFLCSIPDVVRISPRGPNEYHLQGIADEKSKHIQNMVARQKPAKLKVPMSRHRSSYYSSNYYVQPPRLHREIPLKQSLQKTSEPKETLLKPPMKAPEPEPITKSKPKEEVISLVKRFKNGIALNNLLSKYTETYNKNFSLSKYGFSSLKECIENISELEIVSIGNESFVIHESESSRFSKKNLGTKVEDVSVFSSMKNVQAETSKLNSEVPSRLKTNNLSSSENIPESVTSKLKKVAQKYSQGIRSSDFPSCFEETTLTTLDLHSLGYKSLAGFIDDVPDIFIRKPLTGSRKDYIIYPVDKLELNESLSNDTSFPCVGSVMIDLIIMNIRRILEAYSEGIKLQEFVHVYSINCHDSMNVHDLGFDNLETFLSSIKERVPLRFETLNGIETIFLIKLTDSPTDIPIASPLACQQEAIPFDAVFPDFQFKQLSLPENHDFSTYIPVYVSAVVHPSHLYIHLKNDETDDAFEKLTEMESFYNGSQSKLYTMKNVHIKTGAACVALWPSDQHWYRALILSIPSMETVRVHYIDYGTRSTIPKSLLRYIKKEYSKFPALALRTSLSFLKPANNDEHWNPEAKERLISMCGDIQLMAKIDEIQQNGVYSIVLCDTNGDKDVYINDELHNEKLAAYCDNEPRKSIPASPEPPTIDVMIPEPVAPIEFQSLNPLQALQAQYFLQAFAAVAPSFAQNENFLKLLHQVSRYCTNSDSMQQNSGLAFNSLPSAMHSFVNSNMNNAYDAASVQGTSGPFRNPSQVYDSILSPPISGQNLSSSPIRPPTDMFPASVSTGITSLENKNMESSSDIFEDDDDEIFQEFCQNFTSKPVRFVKRVTLGDGYKIHIIVFQSKPYASSGDISQLIWNNKEADYLFRRLQLKDVDIPSFNLSEDGNEDLFYQLEKFNVKGVQKTTGFKASILIYPLKVVIKILNTFGHPSVSLRTKLTEEITYFDPNAPEWKEFSTPEALEPEEENLIGVTDDDKIERLCLYDLLAMKEGIKCRRLKMMKKLNLDHNTAYVDELSKLEQMHRKVLKRIEEIKEICDLFT